MSGASNLKKAMEELSKREVRIGWFEGNEYPDGTSVAQVAAWNEFGATRQLKNGRTLVLPARATLRNTIENSGDEMREAVRQMMPAMIATGKYEQGLALIGQQAVSCVQDTIEAGLPPPNAKATVEGMVLGKDANGNERRAGSASAANRTFGQGKGFNTPMIDTGQLKNTVTYEVT